MRHQVDGRKLNRTASHRKALYKNLVISLVQHERIKTTTPKAKEARRLAERCITFAKRGDLHARRHVASLLNHPATVKKLFDELGPRYKDRPGGYTRVMKLSGVRRGDNAELSILEFVRDGDRPNKKKGRKAKKAAKPKKAAAAAAEAAEAKAEEAKASAEESADEVVDKALQEKDDKAEDKKD